MNICLKSQLLYHFNSLIVNKNLLHFPEPYCAVGQWLDTASTPSVKVPHCVNEALLYTDYFIEKGPKG